MEVFFSNLVTDESAAEKLLRDLSAAEEDAEELFEVAGTGLAEQSKEKFLSSVERVKAACQNIQSKALAGAKAADRAVREHPYSVAGAAFGLGLLIGALVLRRANGDNLED